MPHEFHRFAGSDAGLAQERPVLVSQGVDVEVPPLFVGVGDVSGKEPLLMFPSTGYTIKDTISIGGGMTGLAQFLRKVRPQREAIAAFGLGRGSSQTDMWRSVVGMNVAPL
ncbi:MAG: hypothetical protein FWD61_19035 [Phycisphaerales bacterium]|nr:hypothetical protein [Phycisphaerales bacterium]